MKKRWDDECSNAVKMTRKLRRAWKLERTEEAWEEFRKSRNLKARLIKKTLAHSFHRCVEEVTQSDQGLWKIAQWAKRRANKERNYSYTPALQGTGGLVTETQSKIELFKQTFYTPPKLATLNDTIGFKYPIPLTTPEITEREVEWAIRSSSPNKAPGTDEIPTSFYTKPCRHYCEYCTRSTRIVYDYNTAHGISGHPLQ